MPSGLTPCSARPVFREPALTALRTAPSGTDSEACHDSRCVRVRCGVYRVKSVAALIDPTSAGWKDRGSSGTICDHATRIAA